MMCVKKYKTPINQEEVLRCFLRRHFSSGTDVDLNIIVVDGKFIITESTNDIEKLILVIQ